MDQTTKSPKKNIWLICGAVYAIAVLIVLLIANTDALNAMISAILTVLRPVLIGLVLAYFCNPIFRLFERRLFFKVRPFRLRRVLSLLFTYLVVLLIIVFFLLLLIPQLASSIMSFADNYDTYLVKVIGQLNDVIADVNAKFSADSSVIPTLDAMEIKQSIADFFSGIDADFILNVLSQIDVVYVGELIIEALNIFLDIILGFFISLYLLNSKEKRYAQVMRLRRAIFSDETNAGITRLCTITNRSFGGFFRGKLLDSFIISILIYIAISLYGIEYPLLIATIIGLTDIIPIIGPIIGVFPTGFIILLSQPEKVIPFIIIVILVQQLDANIVSPKILGENTGVSSLCVIIAVCTMGTLWGFAGMIMGVPLFATILELSDTYLEKRLIAKSRPTATGDPDEETAKATEKPRRGRLFLRIERKMLRLKQESLADGGVGDLTRFEKLQLDAYNLACKYNIFSEFSDESLAHFAAEEAAIAATVEPVEPAESVEAAEEAEAAKAVESAEAVEVVADTPAEAN